MFGRRWIGRCFKAARSFEGCLEAGAPVGVLHRVDDDDGLVEDPVDRRIVFCSEQVIGESERGIGARDFIAMHAIGQPDNGRRPGNQVRALTRRKRARSDRLDVGLDLVDAGHVLRRADDAVDQLPAFPGARILIELHPVRGGVGQHFHVGKRIGRRGNLLAGRIAKGFLKRRNGRIGLDVDEGLRHRNW